MFCGDYAYYTTWLLNNLIVIIFVPIAGYIERVPPPALRQATGVARAVRSCVRAQFAWLV